MEARIRLADVTPPSERQSIRYDSKRAGWPTVRARGQVHEPGGDIYFAMLTRPFWQFALTVCVLVLLINTLFAFIYLLDPGGISNARPGSFEDAFFFSVQTLATIGYGAMAPQTRFTHVLVTVESIMGVLAVGSLAGIAFARLSRPQARVIFSNKLVIRNRNGVPHLQLRLANWRTNLIVEANMRVYLLIAEKTTEGETNRVPLDLKLVRDSSPVFFLTWTVMHMIDETSPLFGDDAFERLRANGTQMFVMLTGYDQTLGQNVHASANYKLEDIVRGARFSDVLDVDPDGTRLLDFSRFHDVEPDPPPPAAE